MLCIRNIGIREILRRKESIVIYGASKSLEYFFDFFREEELPRRISFIVDKDENKNGKTVHVAGYSFPIVGLKEFISDNHILDSYQMIIAVKDYKQAVLEMDELEELNGLLTYIWQGPFLFSHSQRDITNFELPVAQKKWSIPKVIHYCWFGEKDIPEDARRNIESWRVMNPDFEICEWNEDNYDVHAVDYINEAYESKKYSFVTDYARYDIVYKYGGFYFDTDVELVKNISELTSYRGFFSYEYFDLINSGNGFAAEKGDAFVKKIRDLYKERHFIKADGTKNTTACSIYETDFFKGMGIYPSNDIQIMDDFIFFPYTSFAPLNQATAMLEINQGTYGIHKFDCSWFEDDDRKEWMEKKKNLLWENERIRTGWRI